MNGRRHKHLVCQLSAMSFIILINVIQNAYVYHKAYFSLFIENSLLPTASYQSCYQPWTYKKKQSGIKNHRNCSFTVFVFLVSIIVTKTVKNLQFPQGSQTISPPEFKHTQGLTQHLTSHFQKEAVYLQAHLKTVLPCLHCLVAL